MNYLNKNQHYNKKEGHKLTIVVDVLHYHIKYYNTNHFIYHNMDELLFNYLLVLVS